MGSPDRKILWFLGASSLLLTLLPAQNAVTKPYLRDALLNNRVDCTGMVSSGSSGYPYDAIVVPGGGAERIGGEVLPSLESQNRLRAAARLYSEKLAPKVILLDGYDDGVYRGGGVTPRDFLKRESVPDDAIMVEDSSINTATNMRELSRLAKSEDLRRVAVVSSEYHSPRATVHACAYGVAATEFPVEAPAGGAGNRFTTVLKEKIELLLCLWDPEGRVPTLIRELVGIKFSLLG